MAVSVQDLATYVGSPPTDVALVPALEAATALLDDTLTRAFRSVPSALYDSLVLEVAHEVLKRKDSPSGSSQYAEYGTGQPVAAPRDPLQRVWPVLRKYVSPL